MREAIENLLNIKYKNRILIYDFNNFDRIYDYIMLLKQNNFEIIIYSDIEKFRLKYETNIKNSDLKVAVVLKDNMYVPYDIRINFYETEISLEKLYPNLNSRVVEKYILDIDLVNNAYKKCYNNKFSEKETEEFIKNNAYSMLNIKDLILCKKEELNELVNKSQDYKDWIHISMLKAKIHYYEALLGIESEMDDINEHFVKFIYDKYSKLSSEINSKYPVILPKVLQFISTQKTALIVMDGMSVFDFYVLSHYMMNFDYDFNFSYALIPTTTSISRQSLLAGKYPRQLQEPFELNKEKNEFIKAGISLGFKENQIQYGRTYDIEVNPLTKLLTVIINDIDDFVHSQHHGRIGMYNDINLLGESGKLQQLIISLYSKGFDIYITSDHGNTPCIGIGSKRYGVEVETKSKRMLVLKEYANIDDFINKNMLEYPGYYLDKQYRYFICKGNKSLDNKKSCVMTHGGISIDEVIVPFIKIKAVK